MGLEGSAGGVGPCQGSRPEMSEGGWRNGAGGPRSPLPTEAWLYSGPAAQRLKSFLPQRNQASLGGTAAPRPMWGTPASLPGQLMPSAAGPQGPSSLIRTTILISVFSSYGEKRKIYLSCLAPLVDNQRPTSVLPCFLIFLKLSHRSCETRARMSLL